MSRDAERIQLAMLNKIPTRTNRLPRYLAIAALTAAAVAIITLL
jgi:hypothetical protein